MKKLHLYKMYTPKDVSIFISRKEEDIISLLEKGYSSQGKIGKKMMGFWYVSGRGVLKIQKTMKGAEHDQNRPNREESKTLATQKKEKEV